MTRTPLIGKPSDRHYEIYEIVKGSQQAGCDAAKAGVSACCDPFTISYIS
jgi:Xaa-Pro aminopeptidase